jgi:hypothetical protein
MVMRMAQKLEQPSVLVDVSWNPVLILFTLNVKEVGVAVQIMIFGVVFLGDGINTYITVVVKVETDITSKAVNLI